MKADVSPYCPDLSASMDILQFLQHYHLAGNQKFSGKNSKKGQTVLADTIYLAFSLFLPPLEKHPGKVRGKEQVVGIPAVVLAQTLAQLLHSAWHCRADLTPVLQEHLWTLGKALCAEQAQTHSPDGRELSPVSVS